MIRAGLFYGSTALPSANLANEVGSGYSLGYFDDTDFVPIYSISEEKISVLKNANIYINSDGTYTDNLPQSAAGAVYAYSLQGDKQYQSADAAASDARSAAASNICAYPAYVGGKIVLRFGMFKNKDAAEAAKAQLESASGQRLETVGASTSCLTVTVTKSSRVLFQFDSAGKTFGISPVSDGAKAQTWFKGYKYYGQFSYNRVNGGDITVVNILPLHDYVKGVIPYEMSASWPAEALKAQAMCAKSYALANINKHKKYGFDICNSTDCQVYRGTKLATEFSDACVDSTYGKYLTYDGKDITPFYHSSNGGYTENSENVWNTAIPYLRAVADPYEDLSRATNGIWSFTLELSDVPEILKEKGYKVSSITDVYIDKFTDAGNVYRIVFVDSDGSKLSFEKEKARTILNSSSKNIYTYSLRYNIYSKVSLFAKGAWGTAASPQTMYAIGAGKNVKTALAAGGGLSVRTAAGVQTAQSVSSGLVLEGRGWGHNVGMSQYGAKGMAEKGFTYEQILKHYFTGVEIESR